MQITHQPDENGVMRQIVTPETLRQVLEDAGDDYTRPEFFGPADEWDVCAE
jgi:hypothetical protein